MSLIYFTDRDLGKKFPQILVNAGLAVERHGDLFPPDGSDEQWLEYRGKNGRIAITHNQRIRYTPNELAAVVRYRVALLVVVGNAPFPDLARHFVNSMRRIEALSADTSRRTSRRCIAPHLRNSRRSRQPRGVSRCGIRPKT